MQSPNPAAFFGPEQAFNYMRWEDSENNRFLEEMTAANNLEDEQLKKIFYDWQAYIMKEIPLLPTLFIHDITAVNHRVGYYDVSPGSKLDWADIYLVNKEAAVHQE